MLRAVLKICWIIWIVSFFPIEITALLTHNARYTLSGIVWHAEALGGQWTFVRYYVAVFCVWLALHMVFGWFK